MIDPKISITKMKETEKKLTFRRIGKRKRTQPKKGLFFVLLLVVALFLWIKAEALLSYFF